MLKIEFDKSLIDGISKDEFLFEFGLINTETFKSIIEKIRQGVEENIFLGITPEGSALAPLKPSTVKRKGHDILLFDTGKLRRNVLSRITSNTSLIREGEIFIGQSRAEIAVYLFYGTKNMVARPFFGINKTVLDYIDNILK